MITDEFLNKVKTSLRASTKFTDDEIKLYINSAILDMQNLGIQVNVDDTIQDELVEMAIIYFCKANYGVSDSINKAYMMNEYEKLRNKLSLSFSYKKTE